MPQRKERLKQDREKILRVFDPKSLVRIVETKGDPPERYIFEYQIKSLTLTPKREVVKMSSPRIEVFLPEKYPEEPPQCTILKPIFHPNISEIVDVKSVWEATGDLCEVILFVGELLSFQKYELKNALNSKAAQWVSKKKDIFPIAPSPLLPDLRWRDREQLLARGEELFNRGAYRKALEEWKSDSEFSDHPAIQQRISRAREELQRQEEKIQEAEKQLASEHLEQALKLLEPLESTAGEEKKFRKLLGKVRKAIQAREEKRKKALELKDEAWALLKKGDLQSALKVAEKIEPAFSGEMTFQELHEALRCTVEEEEVRRKEADLEMEKARGLIKKGREEEALSLLESLTDRLGGDLSFNELIRSTRQQVEDKRKQKAEALNKMEEARQLLLSGDPENAMPRMEALKAVLEEEAEYRELLEAIKEGIAEKEALRREIANSLDEAAAHLEAGFAEKALATLSSILPYCLEDKRFDALKSKAEEMLREKELHLEIERIKSTASRLFDTGQIQEALDEYQNIRQFTQDQAVYDEINRTLEWRFDVKLRGARERLKSLDAETARTHMHFASLITPVAQKREADLKALRMEIELVERILSHKREAEHFQTEKKIEAATQEWRKVLSIDPDNAEAQQAIARLRKISHHKEVVAHASRVGLYVFLAIFLVVAAFGGYYTLESENLRDVMTLMEKGEYRLAMRKIDRASPPPLLTRTQMKELRAEVLYSMHMAEGDRFAKSNQWEKALRAYAQAILSRGQSQNIKEKIMSISRAQIGRAEEWAAQGKLEQADKLLEAMIQAIAEGEKLRTRAVQDRISVLLKLRVKYIKKRQWTEAFQSIQALQHLNPQKPEIAELADRFRQTLQDRLQEVERQINEIYPKRGQYAEDITRLKEQIESDTLLVADKEANIKSLETRYSNEARLAEELKALKTELSGLNSELNQHRSTVKTIDDRIRLQGESYRNSAQYQQVDKPAYEFSRQRARELFRLIQEKSNKIRNLEESLKDFIQEQRRLQNSLEDVKQKISGTKKRIAEMERFLVEAHSLEESLAREKTLLLKIQKEMASATQA